METSTARRKPHPPKKEKTRSITYRLPARIVEELETEAMQKNVMFIKGGYDLKRCIETLEDYMRVSGMHSDHRIEGNIHHFIIQHELGMKWSILTEQLLKEIFHDFLPDKNLKCKTTESTVIASIALGSDFSEHDY